MLEETDRQVLNLAVDMGRIVARVVRLEKTLVTIYESLPGFIQAAIAEKVIDAEYGFTVQKALKEMHQDTVNFDKTGRV